MEAGVGIRPDEQNVISNGEYDANLVEKRIGPRQGKLKNWPKL
jgi:hypothetical protein